MAIEDCEICGNVGDFVNPLETFKEAVLALLCMIWERLGGAGSDPVVDGYTGTVPTSGSVTVIFSSPVNTISLGSTSNVITGVQIATSGTGNQLQYIPKQGTLHIGLSGTNKITAVTFLAQSADYDYIANGVDTGS